MNYPVDKVKLLIIDDDPSDQILMKQAIKKSAMDVEIYTASGGKEGIQKIAVLRPRIVIMDNYMPGLNGLETCQVVRSLGDQTKIVICTGVVDDNIIKKAKDSGADECCLKTADYGILINTLKQLIPSIKQ